MTGTNIDSYNPVDRVSIHEREQEDVKKNVHNPSAHPYPHPMNNGNFPDTSNIDPNTPPTVEEVTQTRPTGFWGSVKRKVMSLFGARFSGEEEDPVVEAKRVDNTAQTIGSRPGLEKPKEIHADADRLKEALKKAIGEKKVKEVNSEDESVDADGNMGMLTFHVEGEAELEKGMFDSLKHAAEIRNKHNVNLKDAIVEKSNEQQRLYKQYLDLKAEAEKKSKISKIFTWVGIGAGVIGGAVILGGLIAAVVGSGGAALGAVLGIAAALATVAGGSSSITGSVFKFLGNKDSGKSFAAKERGKILKDEVTEKIKELEDNNNKLTQLWSNLAMLLRMDPKDIFRPT
ncbi:MAG: hypothetical protein VX777_02100 [Chlamydiota bacterium]|nr:hypothetical protein [Chlamydiota bacterium]